MQTLDPESERSKSPHAKFPFLLIATRRQIHRIARECHMPGTRFLSTDRRYPKRPEPALSATSAAVLLAERQRTEVEVFPAFDIFEDTLADVAAVGGSDEHQGAILAI